MLRNRRGGFTLVELLVVIAIIGLLVSLLLPAVQAAREAARRAQCANHLKQLSLACQEHEESLGFFPSGGWGNHWVGDSSLGFGREQPGSWLFNVLPFIEEANVRAIGRGLSGIAKENAIARQNEVVLSLINCPTRRPPTTRFTEIDPYNSARLRLVVRSDYAANAGDFGNALMPNVNGPMPWQVPWFDWEPAMRGLTGGCFVRSEIEASAITDGLSQTLLVGEKNIEPQHYDTGEALNDNQGAYTGFNWDNERVARATQPPAPDTIKSGNRYYPSFGSAHAELWQAAFCDGHVEPLSYDMGGAVAGQLANREDGAVTPGR
jgi:prepilin-type N-terminal cleavage/methylation domain-containing protein